MYAETVPASSIDFLYRYISPSCGGFAEPLEPSLDSCVAPRAVGVLTLRSLSTRRVGVEDAIVWGQEQDLGEFKLEAVEGADLINFAVRKARPVLKHE